MKKTNYILLSMFFLTFNLIQAQEDEKSKFNIIGYGGIGYGIVENDNEPNYNMNSNTGEILLNYNISEKFGIATGVGINELTGNGFNSLGNFYHERTLIKVPLLFTLNSKVSEKFKVFANLGFVAQNIYKDEYRFINNTQTDIYVDWNFGAQFGVGFAFEISDNFSAGINYVGQADFSKFESNTNTGINDKQKMKNINTFGLIFMIEL